MEGGRASAARQLFVPTVAAAPESRGEESPEGMTRSMGQVVSPTKVVYYMSEENFLPFFTCFDPAAI